MMVYSPGSLETGCVPTACTAVTGRDPGNRGGARDRIEQLRNTPINRELACALIKGTAGDAVLEDVRRDRVETIKE